MSETVNVVCYKSKTLKDGSHLLYVNSFNLCRISAQKYQSVLRPILASDQ